MRSLLMMLGIATALFAVSPAASAQESCSSRAGICRAACTPALVASGQQHGGTVQGCLASCNSRRSSCMKSGIWVHMGSQNRGMQQRVEKR